LPLSELSTKKSVSAAPAKTGVSAKKSTTYAEIEPLLKKNTCTACHQVNKRQVGPAFTDIAKRNYSNEKILELIYTPQPKNWPGSSMQEVGRWKSCWISFLSQRRRCFSQWEFSTFAAANA